MIQAVLLALAVMIPVVIVASLLDYFFILPGAIRLGFALLALVFFVVWVGGRLLRAARFRPELSTLALHAERIYPELSGELASGVEFTDHAERYADTHNTASLVRSSIARLEDRLRGVALRRIIDMAPTLRIVAMAALALVVLGVTLISAGDAGRIAAQRWLWPAFDAQWPRRTNITSLTAIEVWPSDTPLRLRANVDRGYHAGMRTWTHYRLITAPGVAAERDVLMNDQTTPDNTTARGQFESLIDPADLFGNNTRPDAEMHNAQLEFSFEAGDHHTETQRVLLVERPAVRAVHITTQPPDYAKGLLPPQDLRIDNQSSRSAVVSILQGSIITARFLINKPLVLKGGNASLRELFPELSAAEPDVVYTEQTDPTGYGIIAVWTARENIDTTARLVDEHGVESQSDRRYRIDVTRDQPPAVAITQPRADESVLPTALIPTAATLQDDIAGESIAIEAQHPARAADGKTQPRTATISETTGRSPRLETAYDLDLTPLALRPGDEVVLTGIARDIFNLEAVRHESVRSAPRRLRIIDEPTLMAQLRTELDTVRQQAVRGESQQRALLDTPAPAAEPGQREMSRKLEAQAAIIEALKNRLDRNRATDSTAEQMNQTLKQAQDLTREAGEASRRASEQLSEAAKKPAGADSAEKRADARRDQEEVGKKLADLASMLDQGRDTAAMRAALAQIAAAQQGLAEQTRKMMPETIGKSPEELTPAQKQAIKDLADRQASLAKQAEALARQMQSMAAGMSKPEASPAQKAAAKSLEEAARIARQQGLNQSMQKSASSAQQNKLSDASQSQQASSDTMKQMMEQIDKQDEYRRDVLRRQLAQLAEAIQKLIDRQKEINKRTSDAVDTVAIGESQGINRRNTMAVGADAKAGESGAAAGHLGTSADQQADALSALSENKRSPAKDAQALALTSLDAALKEVQKAREELEDKEKDKAVAQLRETYEKLAGKQSELRATTEKSSLIPEPDRRERAGRIELGHRQADLQLEIRELQQKVEDTLLFRHLHGRVDEFAQRAAGILREARADDAVLTDQASIVTALKTMAAALKEPKRDKPFSEGNKSSSGGGGGGSGGKPPLVPPAAELRLLRGLQEDLYNRTRAAQRATPALNPTPSQLRAISQLSADQMELSQIGRRLVEQMKPQAPR